MLYFFFFFYIHLFVFFITENIKAKHACKPICNILQICQKEREGSVWTCLRSSASMQPYLSFNKTTLKWIRLHSEERTTFLSLVRTDMLTGSDCRAFPVQQRRLIVLSLPNRHTHRDTRRRRRISVAVEQRKWRGKANADDSTRSCRYSARDHYNRNQENKYHQTPPCHLGHILKHAFYSRNVSPNM